METDPTYLRFDEADLTPEQKRRKKVVESILSLSRVTVENGATAAEEAAAVEAGKRKILKHGITLVEVALAERIRGEQEGPTRFRPPPRPFPMGPVSPGVFTNGASGTQNGATGFRVYIRFG